MTKRAACAALLLAILALLVLSGIGPGAVFSAFALPILPSS